MVPIGSMLVAQVALLLAVLCGHYSEGVQPTNPKIVRSLSNFHSSSGLGKMLRGRVAFHSQGFLGVLGATLEQATER